VTFESQFQLYLGEALQGTYSIYAEKIMLLILIPYEQKNCVHCVEFHSKNVVKTTDSVEKPCHYKRKHYTLILEQTACQYGPTCGLDRWKPFLAR
jgi:hypothetical protein